MSPTLADMGAKYAIDFQRTASTTASVGNISAPATGMRRIRVYFAQYGCEGDAADNEYRWLLQRTTANGTRTAVTPQPLDPADAASAATAGENHTVEPTYTAGEILLHTPLNQRATYQWYAPPGGELVIPATANYGLGLQTPVATALVVTAQFHVEE